jgi:cytochrome c oxidase subunit 2
MLFAEAPTHDLSIFDPVSPPAESIRSLSVLVLAITGFIFVVVEGILIYAVIRFWRRVAAGSAEPPQVYGSKPIEIAWTAAPALIVFILVLVTARTLWEVNVPPPQPREGDNTLFVTVVGRQWWWEYTYDHYNGKPIRAVGPDGRETDQPVITANELHVPAGEDRVARPVYLTLKSADVCHSFWVPRLAGKTDLIPGRTNSMWFRTDRPGLYVGQCAEYCGTQHANMLLRVVVESPRDFDSWLENQRKPAAPASCRCS